MRDFKSLAHTRWDCKYHVVFIPKRRRKLIYGKLRKMLGDIFHELASRKDCRIEEGHLMADHVHILYQYSAKVFGIQCCWVFKRKECNYYSQTL